MSVSVFVRIKPPTTSSNSDLCLKVHSPQSISISDTTVYSSPIEAIYSCDKVIGPGENFSIPPSNNKSVLYIGYGHSGSGKTHTMFGQGGVLNSIIEQYHATCSIQFFQVYNEKLFDLLIDENQRLIVQSDGSIPHLTTVGISSISELFSVVDIGLSNRRVAGNAIHAHSSRSHAILRIFFPSNKTTITRVDLAGSERA